MTMCCVCILYIVHYSAQMMNIYCKNAPIGRMIMRRLAAVTNNHQRICKWEVHGIWHVTTLDFNEI